MSAEATDALVAERIAHERTKAALAEMTHDRDMWQELFAAACHMSRQYAYRWETHADPTHQKLAADYQRALICELGEAGWEFVGFSAHWGAQDGRTMLFKRAV